MAEEERVETESSDVSVFEGVESEPLAWEVRLWENQANKRWTVVCLAAFVGFLGTLVVRTPVMGVIAFSVVILSAAEMFFALKYKLDKNGASVRCGLSVTSIDWASVKRLVEVEGGVKVSPLPKPSRLDAFRGVYLRYAGNEALVKGKIREFWKTDADILG